MSLPQIPRKTETFEVEGVEFSITRINRETAVGLDKIEDAAEKEIAVLAASLGCTKAEAKAWREATDHVAADLLLDEILVFSGLISREQMDKVNAAKNGRIDKLAGPDPQPPTSEPS